MAFKKKTLITIAVVVGFDVIASLASRLLQFEYMSLILVSLAIYLAAGYWGAHKQGFFFGLLLAAVAGLTDSTIGWWVSTLIRPYNAMGIPALALSLQLIILVIVTHSRWALALLALVFAQLWGKRNALDARQIVGRERRKRELDFVRPN